jgi:hypothetical protein
MPRSFFGGTYMVPEPPNFDWKLLESTSALTFTELQRIVLVAAMHRYLRYLTVQHTTVHMKDVKRQCEGILKYASALVDLLSLHTKNAPSDESQINLHQVVFSLFPLKLTVVATYVCWSNFAKAQ